MRFLVATHFVTKGPAISAGKVIDAKNTNPKSKLTKILKPVTNTKSKIKLMAG